MAGEERIVTAYPTNRILMFDKDCNPIRELAPSEVLSRVRHEVINGEHALTIETTRRLEVGWRALTVDATGRWREWVVEEPDELHDQGLSATGTYRLVWSLQYDLTHTFDFGGNLGHKEVGMSRDAGGGEAVAAAITGTRRWVVGTCDVQPVEAGNGVVMIAKSAWDKLSAVVDAWGGELDAQIEVGLEGVTARRVCLLEHVGAYEATRRFEWGHDLESIRRTPDPGPYYCRVVPIGKGHTEYAEGSSTADNDSYSFEWPLSLLDDPEYNPDLTEEWIEDEEAVAAFRVSDGRGGWEYPTKVVEYDEDDVELLYKAAVADLHNHTRPNVTYEASVTQLVEAGMDTHGVGLGDEVQVIDRGFNPDAGLTLQQRVTEITVDELDDGATELVIGDKQDSLASRLAGMVDGIDNVTREYNFISTDAYIRSLLDRINKEINATGGYSYLVAGEGLLTYDKAVQDPLNPIEASQVVQIKGGSIRIANTRTPEGDWDWKTVFQSGHIVTELVTGGRIETGYIGNPNSNGYWDIDNDIFRLGAGGEIAGRTIESLVNGVWVQVTDATVVTQWMQVEAGAEMPNLYDESWDRKPPDLKANMTLWKRDEVTLTTNLGTTVIYRNVESVFSASNLLPGADDPQDTDFYVSNAEISGGVIRLESSMAGESRFHAMWNTQHLTKDVCDGYTFRLTFEARKTSASYAGLSVDYAIMSTDEANLSNFPSDTDAKRGTYAVSSRLTTQFKKFTTTFAVPGDMSLGNSVDPWGVDNWLTVDFWSLEYNAPTANLLPTPSSSNMYLRYAEVDGDVIRLLRSEAYSGPTVRAGAMWRDRSLMMEECQGHTFRLTFEARRTSSLVVTTYVTYGIMHQEYIDGGTYLGDLSNGTVWCNSLVIPQTGNDALTQSWKTYEVEFTVTRDLTARDDSPYVNDPWGSDGWLAIDVHCMAGSTSNYSDVEIRNMVLLDETNPAHASNDIEIRNVSLENVATGSFTSATAQYYLSDSNVEPVGGEWSTTCPQWDVDHYFWTRSALSGTTDMCSEPNVIDISAEQTALERGQSLSDTIRGLGQGLTWTRSDLTMAIFDAARTATDYLTYRNGKLILGATDSAIRNVMTNSRNSFETNGTTVAYFGFDDVSQLWQLFIANAQITDMLRFGDFAWIARANGNMTLKWMGE